MANPRPSSGHSQSVQTQIALNGQALEHIEGKLEDMKSDVQVKHQQNRTSIHELKNGLQDCVDLITGIRIANARWNIGAGIVTALLTALIHHIFSK